MVNAEFFKEIGTLEDYKLTFRGRYKGVANIESCKGSDVPIVLWEITEVCETAIDLYEGYPNFSYNGIHPKPIQIAYTECLSEFR